MNTLQKIKIVLPAYNEEDDILTLLNTLDTVYVNTDLNIEVLVVNDGSKDRTAGIVQNFSEQVKTELLHFETNRGLGAVLKDGIMRAVEELDEEDIVVTMDSDNSHNPYLIARMVQQVREGSDIVIASRYRKGSRTIGLSMRRVLVSYAASAIFTLFAKVKGVRDYTCGYRAYKVSVLKKGIQKYGDKLVEETGFSCMVEILLKLSTLKPNIFELPMILRYDAKKGSSKMNVKKTIINTFKVLRKYHTQFKEINPIPDEA